MKEQFEVVLNGTIYLFKRMYHADTRLTYHVHHQYRNRNIVFRIGLNEDQQWYVVEQKLPEYVYQDASLLIEAIKNNESCL
jgi:hypothetical protein